MKRTWLKYMCAAALAVATALPVGAQSIQTGFGERLTLPAGIQAVDLEDLSGPQKQANEKLKQKELDQLNEKIRTYINTRNKDGKEPYTGDAVKGSAVYQLQGTDQEGHHVGYLVTTAIDDGLLPYLVPAGKTVKNENGWGLTVNKTYSDRELAAVNQLIKDVYAAGLDEVAAHMPKEYKPGQAKGMAARLDSKGAADWKEALAYAKLLGLSFHTVDVKSATSPQGYPVGRGEVGLDLSYDGFTLPLGLTVNALDNGKVLQVSELVSIDASRPFWTGVMKQMLPASSTK